MYIYRFYIISADKNITSTMSGVENIDILETYVSLKQAKHYFIQRVNQKYFSFINILNIESTISNTKRLFYNFGTLFLIKFSFILIKILAKIYSLYCLSIYLRKESY